MAMAKPQPRSLGPSGQSNLSKLLTLVVSAVVATIGLASTALLLAAGAQNTASPTCLWLPIDDGTGQSAVNFVVPDGAKVRGPSGEEFGPTASPSGSFFKSGISDGSDWRVVHEVNGSDVFGPECARAAGEADGQVTGGQLEWLSGASVDGTGAFGNARVTWQPTNRSGETPDAYEVTVWRDTGGGSEVFLESIDR